MKTWGVGDTCPPRFLCLCWVYYDLLLPVKLGVFKHWTGLATGLQIQIEKYYVCILTVNVLCNLTGRHESNSLDCVAQTRLMFTDPV